MDVINAGMQLFDMCAKPATVSPTKVDVAALVQPGATVLGAVSVPAMG